MSNAPTKLLPNGLRDVNRFITTHDNAGKAILSDVPSEDAVWDPKDENVSFFLAYTTRTFPVSLGPSDPANESSVPKDIESYSKDMSSPPGLSVSSGTVLRFVDFGPNHTSPMHRTVSLDYGVVIEGTMELILDSGEKRIMRRGDVCVQRATNHAWRNVTENDGWARMMFVLVASERLTVAGKDLGEDLGVMQGLVKASD